VMVALSYPEHFVVQRPPREYSAISPSLIDVAWSPWLDLYPYYAFYSPFGYFDPYYYGYAIQPSLSFAGGSTSAIEITPENN